MIHLLLTYAASGAGPGNPGRSKTLRRGNFPDAKPGNAGELAASADARSSSPESSQPATDCDTSFPLFLNPTTSGLAGPTATKAGTGTKLRATIIDSVTDNKHYFYR
jgi:hypothetical protein